jgi:hypothetical protein
MPFQVDSDDDSIIDFTGWKVYFIVKKTLATDNIDAIIDEVMDVDPVSGVCSFTNSDETTAGFAVGNYICGSKVVDADGNVAHTDVDVFIVRDVAYKGPTA